MRIVFGGTGICSFQPELAAQLLFSLHKDSESRDDWHLRMASEPRVRDDWDQVHLDLQRVLGF